jgi:hypothetical protein
MLGTVLNFAAALAGLIAAWRWYQRRQSDRRRNSPTVVRRPSTQGRSLRSLRSAVKQASGFLDRVCRFVRGPCDHRPLLRTMSAGEDVQPVFIRNGF